MNGKYQPGQKVFLTGGNKNLIKEATVLKYTGGFYTIRFNNGDGVKVRESRIYPSREAAEAAILNRREYRLATQPGIMIDVLNWGRRENLRKTFFGVKLTSTHLL